VLTAGTVHRLPCSHIPLDKRPAISSLLVMMRFKLELKAYELSFTHAQNEAIRKEFEASQRNMVGMLFGDSDDQQASKKLRSDSAKSRESETSWSSAKSAKDSKASSRSAQQEEEDIPLSVTTEDVVFEFRGVYGQSRTPHPIASLARFIARRGQATSLECEAGSSITAVTDALLAPITLLQLLDATPSLQRLVPAL
jgi:hypothetical protein